jgi:hypothetical protein
MPTAGINLPWLPIAVIFDLGRLGGGASPIAALSRAAADVGIRWATFPNQHNEKCAWTPV